MTGATDIPDLVLGCIRWVLGNSNYGALKHVLRTRQDLMEDFQQDLLLAWYETEEVELTGDFVKDCRNRALFRVVNKYDYAIRHRRNVQYDPSDIGASTNETAEESADTIDDTPSTLMRRRLVRHLACSRSSLQYHPVDLTEILKDQEVILQMTNQRVEHPAISRRNWWRLMNR